MRLFRRKKNKMMLSTPGLAEKYPDFSPATLAIIERVAPYTMTSPERIAALCEAVRYIAIRQIPGAIVECGVWRGGSVLAAIETLYDCRQHDRELWLYDTFDGMTEPTESDVDFLGQSANSLLQHADRFDTHSVWCRSQLEQVRELLATSNYPQENFRFVVGPVETTIPEHLPPQIAILRLDTDWYESTRHELTHLLPRLVPGGVLIIDDYGHWNGCRRAVDEFFEKWHVPMLLNRIDYTGRIGVLLQPFTGSEGGELNRLEDRYANP